MKIFNIITPRRVAVVALAVAIAYAVAAFLMGGDAPMLLFLVTAPLLLLGGLLLIRAVPAAWAAAIVGLGIVGFVIRTIVVNLGPGSDLAAFDWSLFVILTLIGLAGLLSELPHLGLPHLRHPHGPKPAH